MVCAVYVLSCHFFESELIQNLFPALAATVYAEIMARVVKAPATPILACSVISLVPGGKLYYTTYYFVVGDMRESSIDSRNSLIGCITKDQIVGKVFFRVWPFKNIRFF